MVRNVSELMALLAQYAKGELCLEDMHDRLSLSLQGFFDGASEEDIELLSEIHSALYEVEDGVLEEEAFRRAVWELTQDLPRTPRCSPKGKSRKRRTS
jgi:hypothetical protein